jgi:hypothetical protein
VRHLLSLRQRPLALAAPPHAMEFAYNCAPGHAKLSRDCGVRKALALQALQPFGAIEGPWRMGCAGTSAGQPLPDLADPLVRDAERGGDCSDGKPGAQSFEDGAVAVVGIAHAMRVTAAARRRHRS